jgi:hypothetical protein
MTCGADVEGTVAYDWVGTSTDRWTNGVWTRGIDLGEWKSATWPRHGLPCSTHSLVNVIEKKLGSMRFEPTTSEKGGRALAWSG